MVGINIIGYTFPVLELWVRVPRAGSTACIYTRSISKTFFSSDAAYGKAKAVESVVRRVFVGGKIYLDKMGRLQLMRWTQLNAFIMNPMGKTLIMRLWGGIIFWSNDPAGQGTSKQSQGTTKSTPIQDP